LGERWLLRPTGVFHMGQSRLILFCPRRFQVDYYSPLLQETVGMVVYRGVSLRDSKTASEWKGWMVEGVR